MKNDKECYTKSLHKTWLTIKLLSKAEPSFTEPAIRNYVFKAKPRKSSKGEIPGNGLEPHIRRVGSKILINHGGFLSWIASQSILFISLLHVAILMLAFIA
ncbi:MAG: hypothetical protein H6936_03220 [Burkholderiales bacterium]|nr:hypothetical protein [Nitrosomonas sp.]MCP5273865.1 hypothetical protein [Burkholderiales bacterium]